MDANRTRNASHRSVSPSVTFGASQAKSRSLDAADAGDGAVLCASLAPGALDAAACMDAEFWGVGEIAVGVCLDSANQNAPMKASATTAMMTVSRKLTRPTA